MESFIELICFVIMLGILMMILPTLIDIAITFALVMLVIMTVNTMVVAIEEAFAARRERGACA